MCWSAKVQPVRVTNVRSVERIQQGTHGGAMCRTVASQFSNSSGLESDMGFWGLHVLRYSKTQGSFLQVLRRKKPKLPAKKVYMRFMHQIILQLVTLTIWSLWAAQWLHTARQGGVNGRGQFSLYLWPTKFYSTEFLAAIMWYVLITHELLSDYLNEGLPLKIIVCGWVWWAWIKSSMNKEVLPVPSFVHESLSFILLFNSNQGYMEEWTGCMLAS